MGKPYLCLPAGIELKASIRGLGAVRGPDLMEWHSLCHTFWAVVFCLEHGGTQNGYPFDFGCRCIIFRDFRIRTKVEYGGDTEGPELFHT